MSSNKVKNKRRKKRKKKPKDTVVKCTEVEKIKSLLVQTIEEKDAEKLSKYLSLEGLDSSITKEYLDIGLNEGVDEKNNTILHLASFKSLHDHV